MRITAQFPGTCWASGQHINPGVEIEWNKHEGSCLAKVADTLDTELSEFLNLPLEYRTEYDTLRRDLGPSATAIPLYYRRTITGALQFLQEQKDSLLLRKKSMLNNQFVEFSSTHMSASEFGRYLDMASSRLDDLASRCDSLIFRFEQVLTGGVEVGDGFPM